MFELNWIASNAIDLGVSNSIFEKYQFKVWFFSFINHYYKMIYDFYVVL